MELLAVLIGIIAGAAGYMITTFWVQPILRYRELKYQAASELMFFANAVEAEKLDGTPRPDSAERKQSNRRCAAALLSIYSELPFWYRKWLAYREENPIAASAELFHLSNTDSREEVKTCQANVRTALRLPSPRDSFAKLS